MTGPTGPTPANTGLITDITVPAAPPTAQQEIDRVVSSAMMVFGTTGSGKTSLIVTLVEYVWATYRKVSLIYITDGGGIPPQLQALVNRGIARIWKMRSRSGHRLAFETCQRASQGYWPAKINPRTGECDPSVRLVAPLTTIYEAHCPAGHVAKTAVVAQLLMANPAGYPCPSCGTAVTPQTMKVVSRTTRTKGFEQVGAVFYDGASSQCSWMMDDLGERAGKNELGGEKGNLNTVVSGDLSFGATNRGAFGLVQTRIEQMILNSNGIPDLVVPPLWTALTLELSDDGGLTLKGPLLIGQAKTPTIGEKFGDTLEAMTTQREGKRYRQLRLSQWIDEKGVRHLCQVRSYPGLLPAFLEEEEVGQGTQDNPGETTPFTQFNLGYFYQLRERAKQQAEARITAQYDDAPGLAAGEMEYGETTATALPQATPAPRVAGPVAAPLITPPVASTGAPTLSPAQMAQARARAAAAVPVQKTAVPAPVATAAAVPATTPAPVAPAPPSPSTPVASTMATGPVVAPSAPPAAPVRGPVAPPPGRRPLS